LDPIQQNDGALSDFIFHILNSNACDAVKKLSTSLDVVLQTTSSSADSLPDVTPEEYAPVLADCSFLEQGVVSEGLMSTLSAMTFQAHDVAAMVYLNYTGESINDILENIHLEAPAHDFVEHSRRLSETSSNITVESMGMAAYVRYQAEKLRDLA